MKITLALLFVVFSFKSVAQNGYIKMADSDSVLLGYLRYFNGGGQTGIEFWRTKKDKSPLKVTYSQLSEYAIKKDTFKIIHGFKPFLESNEYFEYVKAKLISGGKVNLYTIPSGFNTYQNSGAMGVNGLPISLGFNPSPGKKEYAYLLELEKIEYQRALPYSKEDLVEELKNFFPLRYLERYAEENGVIRYNDIPDLVKLYNTK